MARAIHKLSDRTVRAANKPGRLSDGGGLYLRVGNSGNRSWSFMWNHEGKRDEIGLGGYPAKSLSSARETASQLRTEIAEGRDPRASLLRRNAPDPTFRECANLFLDSMESQWRNPKHRAQWRMTLGEAYSAHLQDMPVSDIGNADILKVLSPVWESKNETASRLRGRIERVLNFAKVKGWRTGENPAIWRGNLENVLPRRQKLARGHHRAMPYQEVPKLMEQLNTRDAIAARTLEFLILTTTRSGETLNATWQEIDFEACVWTIPAIRMKAGKAHRVPLTEPTLDILKPLSEIRVSDYVFPGQKPYRPMSNMALHMLLRRMNVERATIHGFRSSFRDWAGDETVFARETAEECLAHVVGNAVERAYRRGDALEKRRRLMEAWAAYCLSVPSSKVVPIRA